MEQGFTGLVIGYGSVGRRHALKMAELTSELAIVETHADARERARQAHPAAHIVEDLPALDGSGINWNTTVAVIASWGPSHSELFHALADRGVRRILCEKPMAASVYDADTMARRAEREAIVLGVHHFIRYAGMVPALQKLFAEHQLGEPVSMVAEGGAACLLTNGIHWIDFATALFSNTPQRVCSTAYGEAINPRSPDLMLYGGTAIWDFGDKREAVITLSNRSSVTLSARVYLRDAVAHIGGDLTVRLQRRDPDAVKQFPSITRTGPANDVLFEGLLPNTHEYLDGIRAAIEDVHRGGDLVCPGTVGADAVNACVGALVASQQQCAVALPIMPISSEGQQQWPIS
jgi:predicted dehydrogenase